MTDERYETAKQHAADIAAKAEELSTAIYQAKKMGYETVLRIRGGKEIHDRLFQGVDLNIQATVDFHVGKSLL